MGEQFDRAASLHELRKKAKKCKKHVSRKNYVMQFYITRVSSCTRLRDEIITGRYKLRKGRKVKIFRPKKREATAPWQRDRIWQQSMIDNGVYDDLVRGFIPNNFACQRNTPKYKKGTDAAIRNVINSLQRLYRKAPGQPIYGVHLDIKKYFPSTPHEEVKKLDQRKITDKAFLPFLEELIESNEDERPKEIIDADPFGERGTGLGSPINQLHQVALIDHIDHKVTEVCKEYFRYNDDFLILSHSKETLRTATEIIETELRKMGLIMTNKAGIFKAQNGFYFLRKRFIITDSGKIIIRLHPDALRDERKALKQLKREVDEGKRTMEFVRMHYQSFIANAEYAGDGPIRVMDEYYTKLFREHPKYKRKKRYLYGRDPNTGRASTAARKRKQAAQGISGGFAGEAGIHSLSELPRDPR